LRREVALEEFVARVFKDGKITVPKRLRDLCGVADGDYVRLAVVEVLKKRDGGEWSRRKVT
jgi:bifunctional DNA-binding transcriptional regulator/antitoxin component of YhaV-PrlF toxin-antitoxin module